MTSNVQHPQIQRVGDDATAGSTKLGRIVGIDMARGVAMFGMVIVHFVGFRQDEGEALATAASVFSGRSMPLFMVLGGVGVTFLTKRSASPERALLIRAVMIFALGLVLTEYIDRLAIVLQAYGLFFVLATVLYRLPSLVLVSLVPILTAIGGYTYQTVGNASENTTWENLFERDGIEALFFDGYYPFFPVGAFFITGIWLGRIDLRSDRVATTLFSVGTAVGLSVHVVTVRVVSAFGFQTDFGGNAGDGMYHLTRLLDTDPHSEMPVWVISALGTSAAVLGLSLLVAARVPNWVHPLAAVGSMSLTFYVYQAWLTNVVPSRDETTLGQEWALAMAVFVSFVAFALIWKLRFRSGPLERILRIGSGPKKSRRFFRRVRA